MFLCAVLSTSLLLSAPVLIQAADAQETTEDTETKQDLAGLKYDHSLELQYADQFSVDYYEDGYALITIEGDGQFLLVPDGKEAPDGLDSDIAVIRQPLQNIYLVATSAMDLFCALDGLDSISLSGTNADGWYIDEAKKALEHIHEMYEEGILDRNFLMRTSSNIIELIVNGQCGSFFGPWWAPNNPLMDAVAADPTAKWEPYLLATEENGSTSYHTQVPYGNFVVVRKGYEHPEIVCKIISVLFDYVRYEDKDNQAIKDYYKLNVDPTARPLAMNVDYNNALQICYGELNHVFSGIRQPDDLNLLEQSYYEACESYLKNEDNASSEDWAAYTSRITACKILNDARTNKVESLYFGETETMVSDWWHLENLESNTYLKIVTGEADLDEFDSFVDNWYKSGGTTITDEVRRECR